MMSETELKKEDIVIVEWQEYAGKRKPAVQARSIVEPNLGEISAGTKLKIKPLLLKYGMRCLWEKRRT